MFVKVACEPKMLTDPWDREKLSKFGLTAIESQPRKDLLVQRGLGVPLNAAHRCREFDIIPEDPEIDMEDLAFLNQARELTAADCCLPDQGVALFVSVPS